MSSQLQCGFIQVQTVSHLLLLWFSVTPLAQWRFPVNNELGCRWNFILWSHVCYKRGWNSYYDSHIIGWTLKILMHYWLTFGQYSCHSENLSTQDCNPKSGRWYNPRSCNWGNHFGLNQPPVFSCVKPLMANLSITLLEGKMYRNWWAKECVH